MSPWGILSDIPPGLDRTGAFAVPQGCFNDAADRAKIGTSKGEPSGIISHSQGYFVSNSRFRPRRHIVLTELSPVRAFRLANAEVEIYATKLDVGRAAAWRAANVLRDAISQRGHARFVMATGNSQQDLIATLVHAQGVDWSAVELFHMDEYINLPETHPGCLKHWMNTRFVDLVHPGKVQYLDGNARDLDAECRRYEALLRTKPIDLCTLGIGENGHIAFNDPHVADFNDPRGVKKVDLDERCRRQQAGEGHFPDFESVPPTAVTATCPMLMSSLNLICCVPEGRKAEAVKNALEGPVSTQCPGSVLRNHPRANIYLDLDSASQLSHSAAGAQ
jgi:glucosamine-6-phosphate deaminase